MNNHIDSMVLKQGEHRRKADHDNNATGTGRCGRIFRNLTSMDGP